MSSIKWRILTSKSRILEDLVLLLTSYYYYYYYYYFFSFLRISLHLHLHWRGRGHLHWATLSLILAIILHSDSLSLFLFLGGPAFVVTVLILVISVILLVSEVRYALAVQKVYSYAVDNGIARNFDVNLDISVASKCDGEIFLFLPFSKLFPAPLVQTRSRSLLFEMMRAFFFLDLKVDLMDVSHTAIPLFGQLKMENVRRSLNVAVSLK